MGILNVISRDEGCVGDIRKVGKFSYQKSKNGKWGLLYDEAAISYLTSLHRKGLTNEQVSEKTGIPRPRITTLFRTLGLSRYPERAGKVSRARALSSDVAFQAKVISLYTHQLFPCWLIAQTLCVGEVSVRTLIRESVGLRSEAENVLAHKTRTGRSKGFKKHARAISRHRTRSIKSFKDYTDAARRLSNVLLLDYRDFVDPEGLSSSTMHLDHQFSIFLGFHRFSARANAYVPRRRSIPLEVLCHPANLKLIPASENALKGHSTSIRYGTLLRRIEEFDSIFGPVFEDFDYGEERERLA